MAAESGLDGVCIDVRTKNVLAHVPDFVPRSFAGDDATVLYEEKRGRGPIRKLSFRCPCQPREKVTVSVKIKDSSAKAAGEKLAASRQLQMHAGPGSPATVGLSLAPLYIRFFIAQARATRHRRRRGHGVLCTRRLTLGVPGHLCAV